MLWPPDGDGWTRLGALPAIPHIVTAMSTIMTDFSTSSALQCWQQHCIIAPFYCGIVCLSGAEFPVMNLNDSAEEGILVAGWEGTLEVRTNNRNTRINCFFFRKLNSGSLDMIRLLATNLI